MNLVFRSDFSENHIVAQSVTDCGSAKSAVVPDRHPSFPIWNGETRGRVARSLLSVIPCEEINWKNRILKRPMFSSHFHHHTGDVIVLRGRAHKTVDVGHDAAQ